MKPKICSLLLAATLLLTPCSQALAAENAAATDETASTGTIFVDSVTEDATPSAWAADDIQRAIDADLVPDELLGAWHRPITRLEFADLLTLLIRSRGYGFSPVTTENPFLDTESENARRLCNLGVMTGTYFNAFSPELPLTREAAAATVFRLASTVTLPTPYPDQCTAYTYEDQSDIYSWATSAVSFCYRTGILAGVGENCFAPKQTLTVEQAVLLSLRLTQYAADMEPTPLTMTAGSVPLLYSDNPEALTPNKFERSGIYTAETDLTDAQTIDVEYYHWNYMGSYQPMILGIVATNAADTAATIDIDNRGVGMGTDPTGVSEQCYQRFFLSKPQGTISLDAGQTKLILQDTLPGGTMMNARVRLTPHGDQLNIRLVALKALMANDFLPTLPRGIDDSNGRTAGVFSSSDRTVPIDAATVQNFTLCGNTTALRALNPGEYAQSIDDPLAVSYHGKAHMAYYIDGNFSIVYHLNFKNAAGKTLYIRPNDPSAKAAVGHYFVRTAVEGWHCVTGTVQNPIKITLSEDTSLDFLLLGGNYGNVGFHIA